MDKLKIDLPIIVEGKYDNIVQLKMTRKGYDGTWSSVSENCQYYEETKVEYDDDIAQWIVNRPKKITKYVSGKDNDVIGDVCGILSGAAGASIVAKIALDIMSKHSVTNIGWLTEERYQKELWHHRPLSDFWQIGSGIERRLNKYRIFDQYDIAHTDPKILYKEFGVNAEFLIDHAWGRESCTIEDIKNYKPKSTSVSNSQILFEDYDFKKAEIVLKEMIEIKSLELVEKDLVAGSVSLYIGYSKDLARATGGVEKLSKPTNVFSELDKAFMNIYYRTTYKNVPIRRIGISLGNVSQREYEQLDLFVNQEKVEKERNLERAISSVKNKMGKNSILRGMSYQEGATARVRNTLIGGHNGS